ncbi:hypothetical protein N7541_009067 [Penicillium brevicompactum]|uniref:Uncharacterized protein n=1 Tax=Penicillium brevicompactum TaxID=5074 RepID=A0A9W9UNL0_PENBR|nr:hypothetical protein N7541_009067 [Penicillium brevicompactum]
MDRNELEMIIQNLDDQSIRPPSVQISKLSIKDVESSLGLTYEKNPTNMSGIKSLELAPHLVTMLEMVQKNLRSLKNYQGSCQVDSGRSNFERLSNCDIWPDKSTTFKRSVRYSFGPVKLNRRKVMLSGRPVYSVWYRAREALCLNVLIVEAKGAKGDGPIAQLLGYMAQRRKKD